MVTNKTTNTKQLKAPLISSSDAKQMLARLQPLIALVLMVLVISLLTDKFFSAENGWNILRQISINLCLSIGMTMIILSGGIDLSVGAILGLSGAMAAGVLKNGIAVPQFDVLLQFTVFGAIAVALLTGLLLGLINGVVITRFRVPPFVATLGMLSIARGLTMLWTGGFPVTGLGQSFAVIGTGVQLGIPMPVWISAALAGIFFVVVRKTRFGRYLYAVGGNERAALLTGLPVNRIKIVVYALGGLLAAAAGLIVTARLDSAQPNAGLGYELDSIAAVVIGGTSLSGGRGSILGSVLGCLIIGVLNNGLFLLDVSPFWQQVVKGLVILVAVAIDKLQVSGD
jgi:ribose transport system permease protein